MNDESEHALEILLDHSFKKQHTRAEASYSASEVFSAWTFAQTA